MRRHSASESAYRMLLADNAYDSDALRKLVRSCGAWALDPRVF
jgi:hypothetical protein